MKNRGILPAKRLIEESQHIPSRNLMNSTRGKRAAMRKHTQG